MPQDLRSYIDLIRDKKLLLDIKVQTSIIFLVVMVTLPDITDICGLEF